LKIQEYIKNNYNDAYKFLILCLDEKHPENWKGNLIKIWKIKFGYGFNYFHFSTNINVYELKIL